MSTVARNIPHVYTTPPCGILTGAFLHVLRNLQARSEDVQSPPVSVVAVALGVAVHTLVSASALLHCSSAARRAYDIFSLSTALQLKPVVGLNSPQTKTEA